MTSLARYQVDRDNPESLLLEKERLEIAEVSAEIVIGKLPDTRVFRRPVDVGCERFTRSRLRYLPQVEVMDQAWYDIIKVANRIRRAEMRRRQIRGY